MQMVEASNQLIEAKYENWSKVLIEPSSMNMARIEALEQRLKDEEKARIFNTTETNSKIL
jgi:hypothetical protein